MKEFRIILEERELKDNFEPISRKTVANQYMSSPIEDDEYYELYIKVSVYSYEQCEDDFISRDYDFYVQDLIKDGLVVKENK